MSVTDALSAGRIQSMMDKLAAKTEWDTKQLARAAFRNKHGDPYVDLKWVPAEFLEQAGQISMLTALWVPWLYPSARACLRCGPHVMLLVGVGTFYLAAGGRSSWLFSWPISEQVKLGVSMEKISDYLAELTLPDMLAFVKKGFHMVFHMVLTARRVVWVPYGYNVAIVSHNTELEDAGAGSKSHILAMPILSDIMASRDLSPEVAKILVESVSAMRSTSRRRGCVRSTAPSTSSGCLISWARIGDAEESSQPQEDAAKSVGQEHW